MALPDLPATRQRLEMLGATATAPECHGVLCGLLAVGADDARTTWLAETIGEEAPGEEIDRLYDETLARIDDTAFAFELFLPGDEDADLGERTRALADWAGGFAFGVACAGRHPEDLPGEVAEFVRDVAEIAGLAPGEEGEGDESDYAELVEYLRAGTMLARTECRGGATTDGGGSAPGRGEDADAAT